MKKDLNLYNLVMAYPAIEEFALSSLGYMWLYKMSDAIDGVNVTRISTDNILVDTRTIDSIAFSMSFDFDFMGVFEILEKLDISFYSNERGENDPIVFAGGPVLTTNPRPYERFFDFMMIGDGENSIKEVLEILKTERNKKKALTRLQNVEGVYIPSKKVRKRTEILENVIYTPEICDKSYFKNTFIVEVSRGCMNRCAFCTASYLNLPFREYEYDKVIDAIDFGLKQTKKIALLGAQIASHSRFNDIMNYISNKIDEGINIELGISSLRTDAVTPEMVQILVKGGQKHSTIAIESASERLRKFINKNIKEEQILNAVRIARENGLKGLKIYSMIGIPRETQQDIDEFLRLGRILKNENKGFNIEFSFSTFVPKPQTPFQWEKREDTISLEKKQKYLEKEFSKLGISAKFSSVKWDYWQTVLSRGDEKISELLVYVYKNGGKIGAYKSGVKQLGIDISKMVNGFNFEEELPWDVIDNYPPKSLLLNEYKRLTKKYISYLQ